MSKRRRTLTQKELEEIAAEINIDNESDFDSDDSLRGPDFLLDTASPQFRFDPSDEEDDEESSDIEEALQDLAMEEALNEDNDQIEEDNGLPSSSCDCSEYVGRHKNFEFTGISGPQQELFPEITLLETFLLLVDDEVIHLIVTKTNRFAAQTIASKGGTKYSRIKKWASTNPDEIKKFLGLTMCIGLVRLGALPDYWVTKGIYRQDIPKNTMSLNRYQLLLTLMHFNDNETMQNVEPDEDIVIDETLIPWRGRLIFRQDIPNKAHKYGIKLFKLCSTDGLHMGT
nr:piggyBac transposable element-derived protein 4-like [Leptinotarsa decemlineata]